MCFLKNINTQSYQVYNAKMQNNNFLIKWYPVFG